MAVYPNGVWIETVFPPVGTVPANETIPPVGGEHQGCRWARRGRRLGAGRPRKDASDRTRKAAEPVRRPATSRRAQPRPGAHTHKRSRQQVAARFLLVANFENERDRSKARSLLSILATKYGGRARCGTRRSIATRHRPPAGAELRRRRARRPPRPRPSHRAPRSPGPSTSVISPFGGSAKRAATSAAVPRTTSSNFFVSSRHTATSRAGCGVGERPQGRR